MPYFEKLQKKIIDLIIVAAADLDVHVMAGVGVADHRRVLAVRLPDDGERVCGGSGCGAAGAVTVARQHQTFKVQSHLADRVVQLVYLVVTTSSGFIG